MVLPVALHPNRAVPETYYIQMALLYAADEFYTPFYEVEFRAKKTDGTQLKNTGFDEMTSF